MPASQPIGLLLEAFIETDQVHIAGNTLQWQASTNWIEVTVGVLGATGCVRALTPSLTIAQSHVLSLEEKFQGGTGVNITPPPAPQVSKKALAAAKKRIEQVAQCLGISGFARIDAFMHTQSGEVIIIEANTVPGLTPSTVIYHQALAEAPPYYPREFLESILGFVQ